MGAWAGRAWASGGEEEARTRIKKGSISIVITSRVIITQVDGVQDAA